MPKEVEIKFLLADKPAIERELRRLEFRRLTPETFEANILYDLPGNVLRRRGQLLRLRRYGEIWTLTHKARVDTEGRHKSRIEREVRVADGVALAGILQALGFHPVFRYEKFRSEWGDKHGHVVLDRTPIGDYGEIEGPARWIDALARTLQIETKDYITDSYMELFNHWKKRNRSRATEMTFSALARRGTKRTGKST
jgi:adenylate cyclase class 2